MCLKYGGYCKIAMAYKTYTLKTEKFGRKTDQFQSKRWAWRVKSVQAAQLLASKSRHVLPDVIRRSTCVV